MAASAVVAVVFLGACAVHRQVQYFAATDPQTGATNYYRLTVSGKSSWTKYRHQAGYFSAAAVDVLRGSKPDIAILDLPVEQIEILDGLTRQFHAALAREANCVVGITAGDAQTCNSVGGLPFEENDGLLKKLTRLIWLGSLSQSDLASMGMTQNTDAYEFRKLVFWSTATDLDLSAYAAEIDSVLDNVTTIAATAKTQAARRKKEQAVRSKTIEQIIGGLPMDAAQATIIDGLFKLGGATGASGTGKGK